MGIVGYVTFTSGAGRRGGPPTTARIENAEIRIEVGHIKNEFAVLDFDNPEVCSIWNNFGDGEYRSR
jgi:hypothetical protein